MYILSSIFLVVRCNTLSRSFLLPGILPQYFVPAKLQERLLQPGVQDRGEPPRGRLLAAQSGMAPQLGPEPATFVSVHPNEESRMGGRGRAVSHTVGPVFGEAVVLRGRS